MRDLECITNVQLVRAVPSILVYMTTGHTIPFTQHVHGLMCFRGRRIISKLCYHYTLLMGFPGRVRCASFSVALYLSRSYSSCGINRLTLRFPRRSQDGLLGAGLTARFLSCPGAREVWRYLRRGVILRDAVHPATMQAVRVICCQGFSTAANPNGCAGDASLGWDGTEADLSRFSAPVSLTSEIASFELLMRYNAREADAWGEAGVAAALAEDPSAPGLDGDLDGLGLDPDRRLMLSVFRQEKLALLRGIVSRLTHMRKVSDLLNRPLKMPAARSAPPVLGAPVFRFSSTTGSS